MRRHRTLHRPPGPKGLPLIGVYRDFLKNPAEYLLSVSRRYGDIAHFRLGRQHIYLLNRPDFVQEVLVTNGGNYVKSRLLQRAKMLLGEGLLTSEKAFHLRQRRMLQPVFYRDRLVSYSHTMVECAGQAQSRWHQGETRDIGEEMMRLTLAIVSLTLFSTDVESGAEEIGKAMTAVVGIFDTIMRPFADLMERLPFRRMYRRAEEAREFLDKTIYGMIAERRRTGEDKGDLLSMLLLAVDDQGEGGGMTDQQVRDEAMTLFLAGHETTAVALTWTWYLLSQHPEVEARFHAELAEVLGGRLPTQEDLPKLRYTEMVLSESLRLFPPAWALGRMALKYTRIYNYAVPARSICVLSPYVMHRNPRYYPDPERFDPERWTPEAKEGRPKFAYFPFGGGVRVCIGERFAWMEAMLILATIGQNWKLRLAPGHPVEIRPLITLRPKFGMKMVLESRALSDVISVPHQHVTEPLR
jgi:cytochrome P450